MNKSIKRVHCYTCRLAHAVFEGFDAAYSFRLLKPYRKLEVIQVRKELAQMIRSLRKQGPIVLPVYSEKDAQYV